MSIIISILLIVGVIVALIGTIGCFRFDNFLARTHAASVVDTFATLLIILGLMFHYGFSLFSLKLLLILVFLVSDFTPFTFQFMNNQLGSI